MTTSAARQSELALERFLENVERGILECRLDAYAPPETYGPPTAAELAAARRAGRRQASHTRGRPAKTLADGKTTGR